MGVIEAVTDSVLLAVASVPAGRVTSYGAVGRLVGAGPRVVARVLATHGDKVCWWRVVRADGTIAPQLVAAATPLLAEEGVPVRDGRIDLARYGIDPDAG
jgi:alkylated DNA nucleotide flippase Atl1